MTMPTRTQMSYPELFGTTTPTSKLTQAVPVTTTLSFYKPHTRISNSESREVSGSIRHSQSPAISYRPVTSQSPQSAMAAQAGYS